MRCTEVAVKLYNILYFNLKPKSFFILDTNVNPHGTSSVWHSAVLHTGFYSIPTVS